jgi:AsmA protein
MKRIAVLAVIAVGCVALIAVAVPLLVSPSLIKQRIADRISAATGRTVTISGEPTVSIYPHLAVTIGGLTIAGPKGSGDDPFVVADQVTTHIRVWPLLTGRIDLTSFHLSRPTIHLITDSKGRPNWLPEHGGKDGVPAAASLSLGRIEIADGTVVYDDAEDKRHEEFDKVGLDLTWSTPASSATGSGRFQWRGEPVEFNGTVVNLLDLLSGRGSTVRFAVASTPLRLSFNGAMISLTGADLVGDAQVSTPSLRRVVEWLGTPLGNGSILGPASVQGKLSWRGSVLSLANAAFSLDGNDAQGVASVDFSGPRPALHGTIAASKLDLSPYVEAAVADIGAKGPWPFTPTRLPLANLIDCDLRLSASDVLIGAVRMAGLGATGSIRDGVVAVDIGEADVYGGKLSAKIDARTVDNNLTAHVKATIRGALAQAPLKDLLNVGSLSGKADATIDIGASGATWGALAQSTAGEASLAVAEGAINGVDLGKIARRMIDPLADPMPPGGGEEPFDRLSATVLIANGILSTKDLAVTGQDYDVALAGRGSLVTGSLDANATLVMKTGSAATVPLTISGTWRAPLIGPRQLTLQDGTGGARPRG